ncbi:MAG: hypothetical protein JSV49_06545 [Thermoplasmata archaeon]|nr:MAG: hypothetical protein JSV49_06545 [Thermoplasmata archaeon]
MKLEIGTGSKILGTKKVSAKGQISGLKEYAGKEVMVVLIADDYPKKVDEEIPAEILYKDIQKMVEEQMEQAFKQYKKLNETFKSPNDAAREFIKKISGDLYSERIMKDLNKWLENIVPEIRKDDEDKL